MNKQQSVAEYYNDKQDIIKIKSLDEHEVYHQILKSDKIPKGHKMLFDHESISFYEWLVNKKYMVSKIFRFEHCDISEELGSKKDGYYDELKPVKEIIDYLHKQISEVK